MSEQTMQTGLSENAAAGLTYITIIPAIVFLAIPLYSQSQKIRFHAWQAIFLHIGWIITMMGLGVLGMVPGINLLDLILFPLAMLAFFSLMIVMLVKGFNGKSVKLPIIGELAQKQAGGMGA